MNFSKLSKMSVLSFHNGLRLHLDSLLLFKNKSYPSSMQLSILAMEEFGKYFVLSSFVFYFHTASLTEAEIHTMLEDLYRHPFKQKNFFGRDGFKPSEKLFHHAGRGNYEQVKQKATYVSLPRVKGKIALNGRVNDPRKIDEKIAKRQVKFLNDLIISSIQMYQSGKIEYDEDEVNMLLTEELLAQLEIKDLTAPLTK